MILTERTNWGEEQVEGAGSEGREREGDRRDHYTHTHAVIAAIDFDRYNASGFGDPAVEVPGMDSTFGSTRFGLSASTQSLGTPSLSPIAVSLQFTSAEILYFVTVHSQQDRFGSV